MAIDPRSNRRADRDWYSISVESIRRTLTLLLVVIGAIGGAFAYQQWETRTKTERAQKRLGDAGSLARQIEDRSDYRQVRKEFFSAWENLDAGRQAFEEERFGEALDLADQSFRELRTILDRKQGKLEEQGTFLHVQGNVEYRRARGLEAGGRERHPQSRRLGQDVRGRVGQRSICGRLGVHLAGQHHGASVVTGQPLRTQ